MYINIEFVDSQAVSRQAARPVRREAHPRLNRRFFLVSLAIILAALLATQMVGALTSAGSALNPSQPVEFQPADAHASPDIESADEFPSPQVNPSLRESSLQVTSPYDRGGLSIAGGSAGTHLQK